MQLSSWWSAAGCAKNMHACTLNGLSRLCLHTYNNKEEARGLRQSQAWEELEIRKGLEGNV